MFVIKERLYAHPVCSGGSVLPAVLFEECDCLIMGRVYFEVRNGISSGLILLSKNAVFCKDHILVFQTS